MAILYTVFHFLCSKCDRIWDTICKTDLYCPFCRSQGIIVSQVEIKKVEKKDVQSEEDVV